MGNYYYSDRYRLPVPVVGTTFNEEDEKRLADSLDRLIRRIVEIQTPEGKGSGVVREGNYVGTFISGSSRVRLYATSSTPAIFAFANYIPLYSTSAIEWAGLEDNQQYYLYLRVVESEDLSSSWKGEFETVAYTAPSSDPMLVLIAVATTTSSSISVTINPEGKKYIRFLSDYDSDYDGIVDDTKKISGKSLDYILNRANHIGKMDWENIDTSINKIRVEDLAESEQFSSRIKEIFGDFYVEGDVPAVSNNLTHTIPAQNITIKGLRVVTSEQEITYAPGKDNYVDVNSAGTFSISAVNRGASEPTLGEGKYRLYKVVTDYEKRATGEIIIQRQPTAGDKIYIHNTEFTAVATEAEVAPGNNKFWIGSADNSTGWGECRASLVTAINTSSVTASATFGTAINSAIITSEKLGSEGNVNITLTLAKKGVITSEGLSGGYYASIREVEILWRKLYPYWREPVLDVDSLPSTGIEGETRIVLKDNAIYKWTNKKKKGIGKIKLHNLPSIGDKISIGKIVATAVDTPTDVSLKEYQISGLDINYALSGLKRVINECIHPSSEVTASFLSADELKIETQGTNSDENRQIKVISGSESIWALSGIEGAGEPIGWENITGKIQEKDKLVVKRDSIDGVAGVRLYWTHKFEDDLLFVYKNGSYLRAGADYTTVGSSGINFETVQNGDKFDLFILTNEQAVALGDISQKSFVTVDRHPELPNSLDLETHHKFHDEIAHDSVLITDPGDLYAKRADYKVLGDHIKDDIAHSAITSLEHWWKVLTSTGQQNFRIQGSKNADFSEIIYDIHSSGLDSRGRFYFEADAELFKEVYTADSTIYENINASGIGLDEIHFLGRRRSYIATQSGLDWRTEIAFSTERIPSSAVLYDNAIWVGTDSKYVYKRKEGVWTQEIETEGTQVKSLSVFNDKLMIGVDGEIYEYQSETGLAKAPIVDIPVQWITASIEYGGLFFFATQTPNKIYKWDGAELTEEPVSLSSHITDFYSYGGRLYAASYDGKIYEKAGLLSNWYLYFTGLGVPTNFSESNGILYIAIGRKLYKKEGISAFEIVHIFDSNIGTVLCTNSFIFVTIGNRIYRNSPYIGWEEVPANGLSGDLYSGRNIKFVLSDRDILDAVRKQGLKYIRWKQYPTDSAWKYYPGEGGDGDGGGGAHTFLELADTFNSYAGRNGQFLIVAGNGISSASITGTGEANTASNVGTGDGEVYKEKVGVNLRFRRLKAGSNVTIETGANDVTISATGGGGSTGEANTASNIGNGEGIYKEKVGVDLKFKTLIAGTGIKITGNADNIEIATSGLSGGTGVGTFIGLQDTPANYTNSAYKISRVNSAENAIEFASLAAYNPNAGTLTFTID